MLNENIFLASFLLFVSINTLNTFFKDSFYDLKENIKTKAFQQFLYNVPY